MLEKIEWGCEACQRAVLLVRKERGQVMRRNEPEPGHGKAVVRGGCGCLLLALGGVMLALATGARAYGNPLGAGIVIFGVGAVLGLIGNELFKRGYRRGYANAEEDELKTTDRRLRRAEGESIDDE